MIRLIILFTTVASIICNGQNVSSRTNSTSLDFSSGKAKNGAIPKVIWHTPENEITFLKDGKLIVSIEVESKEPLKSVVLTVRDHDTNDQKGKTSFEINGVKNMTTKASKNITLSNGIIDLEIIAENENGYKSITKRQVHVGATVMADAGKLNRKDYALIIATDKYDNWTSLVNPVFDGRSIANDLKANYGFETDVVENPTREEL